MDRKENTAVVLGAGVLLAVVGLLKYKRHARTADTESIVLLTPENGTCQLSFKEQQVTVGRGQHMEWQIYNFCHEEVRVRVGNFRRRSASSATDCNDEGPDWPFASDRRSEDVEPRTRRRPGSGRIMLRLRTDIAAGEYYYDICIKVGTSPEVTAEPRMFVE